jgi:hypothetical protein
MSTGVHPAGPFIVVRVDGARLALPVTVVERMESQERERPVDLGELCGLCDEPRSRPAAVALKTAAGIVNAGIDGLEELVAECEVLPIPPLTRLTDAAAVRGLLQHPDRGDAGLAVLLDGDALGDRIAEQILTEAT